MPYATWSTEDFTGVPALDRLHQDLFEALDKLSSSPDGEFGNGFNVLVEQAERTFQTEEQWMEDLDFPSLNIHREQHARVLLALHKVNSRVLSGELEAGREVVNELLPQWLAFHISTMDATLANAMQMMHTPNPERSAAAPEKTTAH